MSQPIRRPSEILNIGTSILTSQVVSFLLPLVQLPPCTQDKTSSAHYTGAASPAVPPSDRTGTVCQQTQDAGVVRVGRRHEAAAQQQMFFTIRSGEQSRCCRPRTFLQANTPMTRDQSELPRINTSQAKRAHAETNMQLQGLGLFSPLFSFHSRVFFFPAGRLQATLLLLE